MRLNDKTESNKVLVLSVAQHLLGKPEVMSSIPVPKRKEKKKRGKRCVSHKLHLRGQVNKKRLFDK